MAVERLCSVADRLREHRPGGPLLGAGRTGDQNRLHGVVQDKTRPDGAALAHIPQLHDQPQTQNNHCHQERLHATEQLGLLQE